MIPDTASLDNTSTDYIEIIRAIPDNTVQSPKAYLVGKSNHQIASKPGTAIQRAKMDHEDDIRHGTMNNARAPSPSSENEQSPLLHSTSARLGDVDGIAR